MSALMAGQLVGRYRVDARLGTGGMGEVYRAWDTTLRRPVALKVIRADDGAAQVMPALLEARRARFLREARAAAGLQHPGIVTIFDVGEALGMPYIAMELLEGTPLVAFVGQTLAIDRSLRWLAEIASALAAAHRAGLIHRDVKPENVMVCRDDTTKVLDFGVAKVDGPEGPPSAPHDGNVASFRTGHGIAVGTPRYMAPEQAAGLPIDARADQFAWGLVAYEIICGRHPSEVKPGFSPDGEWREAAEPPLSLRPTLPPEVAAVIARALERRVDARFPSMDPIVQALAPFARAASGAPGAHGGAGLPPPMNAGAPAPPYASTAYAPVPIGSPRGAAPPNAMPAPAPAKSAPWAAILLAAAALLAIAGAGGGYAVWRFTHAEAALVTPTDASSPSPATSTLPSSTLSDAHVDAAAPPTPHDAGSHVIVVHDAGTHKPVHVRIKVMSIGQEYPEAALRNAFDPRVPALEKCLNDAGADPAKLNGNSVSATYLPNGKVLSSTVRCDPVYCACLKPTFADGIDLGPPKSGHGGVVFVTFLPAGP